MIETSHCTLCAHEISPGFYHGCMIRDGYGQGDWQCDGKGNLRRVVRDPKFTPEDIEALVIQEIVGALYPIFYPLEQQDCMIQARHHAELAEIATQAWRMFNSRNSK